MPKRAVTTDQAAPVGGPYSQAIVAGDTVYLAGAIPALPDGTLGARTAFVDDAHAAGLLVHPYTFRNENTFLPPVLREGPLPDDYGRALVEQAAYWEAGIDGMFTDNPDTGVVSRELFLTTVQPVF